MDALKRIVRNYNGDMAKLRFVDMIYYILQKDGAYAGVSLWEGYSPAKIHKIAVHDGTRRAEKTVAVFCTESPATRSSSLRNQANPLASNIRFS
jgi:N4-(beta-N-acetylglucosaminyl)-L-asparaginase